MTAAKLPLGMNAPMAPITRPELPAAEGWGYQIKWDGVRLLADIGPDGKVKLYSRQGLQKNDIYPEIAALLQSASLSDCLLDGELIFWTGSRPSFQRVLQRERMRGNQGGARIAQLHHPHVEASLIPLGGMPVEHGLKRERTDKQSLGRDNSGASGDISSGPSNHVPIGTAAAPGLVYVLFDLLYLNGEDYRKLPYITRHEMLAALAPRLPAGVLTAELYGDGVALWEWVSRNGWEGVISKRLDSPYKEGKQHKDWFKKKTALLLDVDIVGLKIRDGIAASLIMSTDEGRYLGSVSLGLTGDMRLLLTKQLVPPSAFSDGSRQAGAGLPFPALPSELNKEQIVWLAAPFPCTVTGLELTEAGQLRHPKIAGFGRRQPQ